MLTIAMPMAGVSAFYPENEHRFPKVFHEVGGRPMIEVVLENLMTIEQPKRFLFIVNDAVVKRYRFDNVLRMLTQDNCDIVVQKSPTKGAVCSLLLAVKYLNHANPVLVCNADQVIDHDLNMPLAFFQRHQADGGVLCFKSVHPQWSYARVIEGDRLVETAEKEPISRNAIAGQYYFSRGSDFVANAMRSIVKGRSYQENFYTSVVLNEMVLANQHLRVYTIDASEYHSFYSPEKIRDYELYLQRPLKVAA